MRTRNHPDKSIMMMDASCACHVQKHGRDTTLDKISVRIMVAEECGVHPDALEE